MRMFIVGRTSLDMTFRIHIGVLISYLTSQYVQNHLAFSKANKEWKSLFYLHSAIYMERIMQLAMNIYILSWLNKLFVASGGTILWDPHVSLNDRKQRHATTSYRVQCTSSNRLLNKTVSIVSQKETLLHPFSSFTLPKHSIDWLSFSKKSSEKTTHGRAKIVAMTAWKHNASIHIQPTRETIKNKVRSCPHTRKRSYLHNWHS